MKSYLFTTISLFSSLIMFGQADKDSLAFSSTDKSWASKLGKTVMVRADIIDSNNNLGVNLQLLEINTNASFKQQKTGVLDF